MIYKNFAGHQATYGIGVVFLKSWAELFLGGGCGWILLLCRSLAVPYLVNISFYHGDWRWTGGGAYFLNSGADSLGKVVRYPVSSTM